MTIEEIKAECRAVIALAEKATPGEWFEPHYSRGDVKCGCQYILCESYMGAIATIHVDNGMAVGEGGGDDPKPEEAKANGLFIARARTFTPAAAKALLDLIAYVEEDLAYPPLNLRATEKLESIRAKFTPHPTKRD